MRVISGQGHDLETPVRALIGTGSLWPYKYPICLSICFACWAVGPAKAAVHRDRASPLARTAK